MTLSILDAMDDPNLLGHAGFEAATWQPWRAALGCLFGLPVAPDQRELVTQCTGRTDLPSEPFREAWLCCGRRAGKSRVMAALGCYLACFHDWRPYLAPGEVATVALIAADRAQARTLLRYVKGLIAGSPVLRQLLTGEREERIELACRVSVEVFSASSVSVRGYSLAAALLDEIAFWPTDDAADPDAAVLAALRPALATLPGSMLIAASSPHARRGELFRTLQQHHGRAGAPVLTWRAASRTMNAGLPAELVASELQRDPQRARAEWLAEWRSDISAYVSPGTVAAATVRGRTGLTHDPSLTYTAFLDPSGGSSDSMVLAISHVQDEKIILDRIDEVKAPFNPVEVVLQYVKMLKAFGCHTLHGDHFAAGWVAGAFGEHGIEYHRSERPKSSLYAEFLPLLNSGKVELLEDQRMISQLLGLERRTSRAGRDQIDHPPGAHDDIANAVAGSLVLAHERAALAFSADDFVMAGSRDVHAPWEHWSGQDAAASFAWRGRDHDRSPW